MDFEAQIVPEIISLSPFKLTLVSFDPSPLFLLVFPYFLMHEDIQGLSCYFFRHSSGFRYIFPSLPFVKNDI